MSIASELAVELANTYCIVTDSEKSLREDYNKLARILKVIVNKHGGVISKKDWKWVNSSEEYYPYSTDVSDDGTKVFIGVQ